MIIALAAKHKLYMRSIDFTRTFCIPILKEEIYMYLPDGKLVRLLKALYGLKQDAAEWYETIREGIEKLGYRRLHSDNCVFVHKKDPSKIIVVYVDDIIVLAPSE